MVVTNKQVYEAALSLIDSEMQKLKQATGAGAEFQAVTYKENCSRLELLETVKGSLEWWKDMPPTIMLHKDNGWSFLGWTVGEPILEQLQGDRVRMVLDVTGGAASELRSKFQLALVPAALDATEAIVRATHALAGAAIEMTHVLKKMTEKS
jgi:hypothetical protein